MTQTTSDLSRFEGFSLLGGPLYRLGCRLGLVRGGTNSVPLGLAIAALSTIVGVVLALIEGVSQVFSLAVIATHVRLLLGIPLFFVCESWLDPRLAMFVTTIVRSGVVPEKSLPTLESTIARTARLKNSWLADAMCLLVALISLFGPQLHLATAIAAFASNRDATGMTLTGRWYIIVCLPFFRFLLLRLIWRLVLWSYFLWRVARLDLHLVPTHPDTVAGLGYLEVVQIHFWPMIVALSAVQSASFAEEITAGTTHSEAIYPAFALVLVVDAVLFLGPLFLFVPKLWACKVKGLSNYMQFAATYVSGFDKKWLGAGAVAEEPLLGTPDLQSLADLSNSMSIVRNMRWVPVSLSMLRDFALAALVPILPLFLLKYPLAELIKKFFTRLAGL